MQNNLFVEIACKQRNRAGEHICGDTFVYKRIPEDNRTVIVLSDGMGHGVKANVLSTLTASMTVNFASAKEDVAKIARIVLNNLPVSSIHGISYSTFSIIDIDHRSNEVTIAEHDNPSAIIFRGGSPLITAWNSQSIAAKADGRPQTIRTTRFTAIEDDRIIIMTDGVTQSGSGSDSLPFGWKRDKVSGFIKDMIEEEADVPSDKIAGDVVDKALHNDDKTAKDDISCAVIHMRRPRKVLLAACPPADKYMYSELSDMIAMFDGKKILCGYQLAEIIAREWEALICKEELSDDPGIPPKWIIRGTDLVTEGIITVNKVFDLLNNRENLSEGEGAAYDMARILLESDEIDLMLGSKRGTQASPYLTDEFELRRNVIRRIGEVLERKYMKEVNISYI